MEVQGAWVVYIEGKCFIGHTAVVGRFVCTLNDGALCLYLL